MPVRTSASWREARCSNFEGRRCVSPNFRLISDVLLRSLVRLATLFFQLVEARSALSDVGEE